ncbi:MAG: SDR family oxidoreductase [Planctomycetota bacterium]
MKIVVIGGNGLIGKKLVATLRSRGHEVVSASPSTGVNAITGEGLSQALKGAQIVVDVSNSPSFEDQAVRTFFETSTRNLLDAESAAGVGHHVALSVVGADRMKDSGYMQAKVVQEQLIQSSKIPYSIVRATQFFEFLGAIGQSSVVEGKAHIPPARLQPIASDDVVAAVADVALGAPVNGIVDVAGPELLPMAEAVRRFLSATADALPVVEDPKAKYYGAALEVDSLTPLHSSRLGPTRLDQWLVSRS